MQIRRIEMEVIHQLTMVIKHETRHSFATVRSTTIETLYLQMYTLRKCEVCSHLLFVAQISI